jgi:hypothetical protein
MKTAKKLLDTSIAYCEDMKIQKFCWDWTGTSPNEELKIRDPPVPCKTNAECSTASPAPPEPTTPDSSVGKRRRRRRAAPAPPPSQCLRKPPNYKCFKKEAETPVPKNGGTGGEPILCAKRDPSDDTKTLEPPVPDDDLCSSDQNTNPKHYAEVPTHETKLFCRDDINKTAELKSEICEPLVSHFSICYYYIIPINP